MNSSSEVLCWKTPVGHLVLKIMIEEIRMLLGGFVLTCRMSKWLSHDNKKVKAVG